MMRVLILLQSLLVLLLVNSSMGESTGKKCADGWQWSNDLAKCKDCKMCDTSSKDDFCQICDSSDKQGDFPWLIVIIVTVVSVLFLTLVIGLSICLVQRRSKKKFTTPIEETGAHSAEALLIH
ncbi:tumor necrosis factor receptor superfamily member 12A [Leptodactylus fuscus]|uniref:tumor necrosis factor receptor superfamily member 12A n=1 Tax=Leptodactylus fuscus TaxID=238119 RepID=UPI003F4E4593